MKLFIGPTFGRDLFLAVVAAILGAIASYLLQVGTAPRAELTLKIASLSTQVTDEAIREETGKPLSTVTQFAVKNTGNSALKNLTLEFAPGGGDAAYDPFVNQVAFISGELDTARSARRGSIIKREKNTFLVTYALIKPGDTDKIVITNDGLAGWYDVSADQSDVKIKSETVQMDFDPDFADLAPDTTSWKVAILQAMVVGLMVSATILLLRRTIVRKISG